MSATVTSNSSGRLAASFKDYWQLLKPGVMTLVVFTGAAGVIAAPVAFDFTIFLVAILSIAMGSGAGAAINMWYDADIDRVMKRTQKRPIPMGKIHEDDVLALGLLLAVTSVAMLGLATNWAAAALLAFSIWFYACFYTMLLKRTTAQNIVIGGAAGAFPPLIGWLTMVPEVSLEPVIYVLITFFWTPPHFWALALYRHDDYKDANVPMLPVIAGERVTLNNILLYTAILVLVTSLPVLLGMLGWFYAIPVTICNVLFLFKALHLWRTPSNQKAIRLFLFSILYLFLVFFAIMLDKISAVLLV